jgi:hypothetical protein
VDDVEILGRDRRAMDHGGCAAHHDELHAPLHQHADQLADVSFLGVRHA